MKRVTYFYLGLMLAFSCIVHTHIFVVPERYEHAQALRGPRVSSSPYITGDTFRSIADFIVDETKKPFDTDKVQQGDIIFVSINHLGFFFTTVHPHIKNSYILITHNDDGLAPGKYASFLEDEKIIAWFGQNPTIINHPKFFPIPIGIHNQYWPAGNPALYDKARESMQGQVNQRTIFVYLNFSDSTYKDERSMVRQMFANKKWVQVGGGKPFADYLCDLTHAQFVLSPRGNGPDCHRTWEALLMGALPIVKTSALDPLYDGLPVVIVDDWSQVTEEFLINQREAMARKTYAKERIFAPYWLDSITNLKKVAQGL